MKATRPSLSVVVPTRDRADHLTRCLESLQRTLRDGDELIVVDSASTGAAVKEIAGRFGARCLRLDRKGAARARNAGGAEARYDLIAFVDDDVTVAAGWADAVASAAIREPGLAFFTGRLEAPAGHANAGRAVAVIDSPSPFTIDATTPPPLGHSANLAVRRDALAAVGGFDVTLGAGARFRAAEDLDLFDRLLAAGYRGRYEPTARGWHAQWRTRRQLLSLDWSYGIGMGARVAKLVRTDAGRAASEAKVLLWTWGGYEVIRCARAGNLFVALTSATRVLAAPFGFVAGLSRRVRNGHFVAAGTATSTIGGRRECGGGGEGAG